MRARERARCWRRRSLLARRSRRRGARRRRRPRETHRPLGRGPPDRAGAPRRPGRDAGPSSSSGASTATSAPGARSSTGSRRATRPRSRGLRLLLVRNLNPDGLRARDAPERARRGPQPQRVARAGATWARAARRYYSGRAPFSEPESRAIRALLLRERPQLVVWYHQPLARRRRPRARAGTARARRYARRVGLRVRPLPALPGVAVALDERARRRGLVVRRRARRRARSAPRRPRRHARAVLTTAAG